MQINGQLHAAAALSPRKEPRFQLNMRTGGFRSLESFGEGKSLALSGVEPRTVQPVATLNSVIVFKYSSVTKMCQFGSLETYVVSKHVRQSYFKHNYDFVRFDYYRTFLAHF